MMKRPRCLVNGSLCGVFMLFLATFGCKQNTPLSGGSPHTVLQLNGLLCVEMSENRGALASMDDEIVLLQSVFIKHSEGIRVFHQVDSCRISKNGQYSQLKFEPVTLGELESVIVYYALIESDEDMTMQLLESDFMINETLGVAAYKDVLTSFFIENLNSDDVLGIVRIGLTVPDTLSIKGKHLFDDFEYKLVFSQD